MTDRQLSAAEVVRERLVAAAGGYFRNTVRLNGVTCGVCATPVTRGYIRCKPCQEHSLTSSLFTADQVGSLVYAIEGSQSHYVMRGYKGEINVQELRSRVAMLYFLGVSLHTACVGKISKMPVTHWASVPSLPAKPAEHPLHTILAPFMQHLSEVRLTAARETTTPRRFSADHFRALTSVPSGSHVLIFDDTWVCGGHAQSAAHSVRQAGASTVSILNGARYLRGTFGDNAQFIKDELTRDYEPLICPWTGGECP